MRRNIVRNLVSLGDKMMMTSATWTPPVVRKVGKGQGGLFFGWIFPSHVPRARPIYTERRSHSMYGAHTGRMIVGMFVVRAWRGKGRGEETDGGAADGDGDGDDDHGNDSSPGEEEAPLLHLHL